MSVSMNQTLEAVSSTFTLVKDSWDYIMETHTADFVGAEVYQHLFALVPNVASIFTKPKNEMSIKMGNMLEMIVSCASDPDNMKQQLMWLGRHTHTHIHTHTHTHTHTLGPKPNIYIYIYIYIYMYVYICICICICIYIVCLCVYVYRSPPRQLQDPTAAHPTHGACSDGSTFRCVRRILELGAGESLVCVNICTHTRRHTHSRLCIQTYTYICVWKFVFSNTVLEVMEIQLLLMLQYIWFRP